MSEKIALSDFDQDIPDRKSVAVIMERRPSSHPWANYSYDAIGVVVRAEGEEQSVEKVFQEGDIEHFLVTGLGIRLYVDQCESYYHNLMSPEPGCFLVADQPDDDSDLPIPYLASLSFDEAHAYLEGDELVYSVPIPKELYQWSEAYVLTYYVAEKKKKRKLKNWKDDNGGGSHER